jgi:hypothetical protein
MKKEQLSSEEQDMVHAVKQLDNLNNNLLNITLAIQKTTHAAFDYNKPQYWPEVISELEFTIHPLQTETEQIHDKLNKKYVDL